VSSCRSGRYGCSVCAELVIIVSNSALGEWELTAYQHNIGYAVPNPTWACTTTSAVPYY